MNELKELAIAVAYLSINRLSDPVSDRFSQADKDLFADWFIENWVDEWDGQLVEDQLDKIAAKIEELRQIKGD